MTAGKALAQQRVRVRFYVLASLFAALTAAGAFIRVPLTLIQFTLQDFFVFLSGSLLGPLYGALSQLLYLAIGLIGVPVFSHGGGPGYVLQPSFGYLLGFPVAAYVVGCLIWGKHRLPRAEPPRFLRVLVATLAGSAVIFLFGVIVLYLNLKYVVHKPVSLLRAIEIGFVVFIPGALIKIAASSVVAVKLSAHVYPGPDD